MDSTSDMDEQLAVIYFAMIFSHIFIKSYLIKFFRRLILFFILLLSIIEFDDEKALIEAIIKD